MDDGSGRRGGSPPGLLVAALGGAVVLLVVVVALVVVVVRSTLDEGVADVGVGRSRGADGSTGAAPADPEPSDAWGISVGPVDAPHEVIVYEDLLCGSCADFFADAGPRLRALAEVGRIRLIVRPLSYLTTYGEYSALAASALFVVREAAGDEVALDLNDALLAERPAVTGPFPDVDDVVRLAVEAGAREDEVREGIRAEEQLDLIDLLTRRALDRDGVTSVPLVLLDRQPFLEGAPTPVVTRALLDRVG